MTASADIKAAARRVLEEIFPADDEAAVIEAVTDDFINHEAPPGTPPGGIVNTCGRRSFTYQGISGCSSGGPWV